MSFKPKSEGLRIAIDRGGTFTDVWASLPGKKDIVLKLLSVDPNNYNDAPIEGIRRVLSIYTGKEIPRNVALPKDSISFIRMGTTVATNALLERRGSRHALIVTKGFGDVLEIGDQTRPKLFDIEIVKPEVLYEKVVEIDERITPECFDEDSTGVIEPVESEFVHRSPITGDFIRILKPLDEIEVAEKLQILRDEGFETLAVCFTHSYVYDKHEVSVREIAEKLGFNHISLSSSVGAGMIRMLPRCSSASADSYLTPSIKEYINGFASGFEGGSLDGINCEFMQSDGGLVSYQEFTGLKGILSGPAGGVVGYAETCYDGTNSVIGFDMGGTSTDVSRFGGRYEHIFETTTAGVTIQSPQLDITTVAAGGGSICIWQNGLFRVGPESAGAHPGPACYRKGGPLTVTDCNLYLGRILPKYFPHIFGPNEDQPLDVNIVSTLLEEVTQQVYSDTGKRIEPQEVALGFLEVANESMCRPIRSLTEARGYEIHNHILSSFGGAGGQHACEIAYQLGIERIAIHKYSSMLSAYGMSLADVVQEIQEPSNTVYSAEVVKSQIRQRLSYCREKARQSLEKQGTDTSNIQFLNYLNMRYHGTDTCLMILEPEDGNFLSAFEAEHIREFTFIFKDGRDVLIDDIRVRAVCSSEKEDIGKIFKEESEMGFSLADSEENVTTFTPVTFKGVGTVDKTPVFLIEKLKPGEYVVGPAMIIDSSQTIVVIPGAIAKRLTHHVVIDLNLRNIDSISNATDVSTVNVDPIRLSVFGHRFMSIAEQMGHTLQKISVSLNMKERLDFSCAIFGPDGELVANAPHVPVHLGSMSYAIKYQHILHKDDMKPGDVFVSNHPEAGGTHLPDITVITPVFSRDGKEVVFYVASRGHHTDIGGLGGSSNPPGSTELWQEGARIKSFRIVSGGVFDEDGIVKLLKEPGDFPGCSPSRQIKDNLSDLKAQIAANNKRANLVEALMGEYSPSVIHFYMRAIQDNAEVAVRGYLKTCVKRLNRNVLYSEDYMDNSSTIRLKITINDKDGTAIFDFTGTSPEVYGNMNAPPSVTHSAIIYCLRLLVGTDIPLNEGCIAPIDVIIPKGTFLNPSEGPAVCAGNTHVSQRLTDVILKPFEVVAASQGDMNWLGFYGGFGGEDSKGEELSGFSYVYGETTCGGAGAGPGFHGASAVQIHMTNTRCTDVEVIEKRFPVILREFSIRKDSGGDGRWRGGCGVVRDFECLLPLSFSMISERRVTSPYGMKGGSPGERGANYWLRKTPNGDRLINLGPKAFVDLGAGDHFIVKTPGGGGWGAPEDDAEDETETQKIIPTYFRANGSIANWMSNQNTSQ